MKIKPAQRIQEVKEYYFSRKLKEIAALRAAGAEIINLGIGSPDLPPSPEVIDELMDRSQQADHHRYQSYIGIPELRTAFANWYQEHFKVELDASQEILPLMGSKEGIMHLNMTFLEAGDEVLIPNPGYPAYRATALLTGATPVSYELSETNDWLPDLEALSCRDLSRVKIMWINYPHMPTGAKATTAFFETLIDFAKKHEILIVNDNPYSFILNDKPLSLLSIPGAKEFAIELNSLSKSHNMAGWRIGMMAGNATHLQEIIKFKSNMDSGMFLPLQLAAAKALALPQSWYDKLNKAYRQRRQKVFTLLNLLGCSSNPSAGGMFVWSSVPTSYRDGYQLSDDLLYQTGVFITPGGIFGTQGDAYIRISLCSPPEVLDQAIERVQNWQNTRLKNEVLTPQKTGQ